MSLKQHRKIDYLPLAAVPGLGFRHFASENDYQIMNQLWNQMREFYHSEYISTVENLKQDEKWRKHYDIHEQLVIVELDQQPIGYFSWSWSKDEYLQEYMLHVGIRLLQEYWDSPIPQLMMDFQEEQVMAMTAHLTDLPRVLKTWCNQQNENLSDFYAACGYTPTRYFFELSRPIEEPVGDYPLPEGLEIREVKPEHYRKIWDANQEAFKDHWGFTPPTEEQYQAWMAEKRWFQPYLWKIAWDGDEVAGQVGNYVDMVENKAFNRRRAYTEEISVGRQWRGRGLAKALIAESIRMFQGMGDFEETTLGVDADNPNGALRLYTNMGYVEDKARTNMVMSKKI
ncbi:MAG: GNAT family N-acetyltransferase [Anaerolineae bacterium]|jgi:ribosomal protein S18 acetylase RimI-like enzyme|nr:GNAT family N-acetyltransferase [Anaerolineae bacterium]